MKISIVLSATALAVAVLGTTPLGHAALGGADRAVPQAKKPPAASKPNVQVVQKTFTLSNEDVEEGVAECPAGTKVFSGGYAVAGDVARVIVAAPARRDNGYLVVAWAPPVNIVAGVGKENDAIKVIAWCAPPQTPIVLP
jgi:hypothetical protein